MNEKSKSKRKLDNQDDNLPKLMKQLRKKNQMASSQDDSGYASDGRSIDNLPHEILLIIFKQLNINYVCQLARQVDIYIYQS